MHGTGVKTVFVTVPQPQMCVGHKTRIGRALVREMYTAWNFI